MKTKINVWTDYQKQEKIRRVKLETLRLKHCFILALPVTIIAIAVFFTVMNYALAMMPDNTTLEKQELTVASTSTVQTISVERGLPAVVIEECVTRECIEAKIKEYFPKSHETVFAIAKAESGLSMNAVGYNCYYSKSGIIHTTRLSGDVSKACKKEHRIYSWSVDCGVLQKNYVGIKKCPDVNLDEHLEIVSELSRSQGLEAWSAYNNGSYKNY